MVQYQYLIVLVFVFILYIILDTDGDEDDDTKIKNEGCTWGPCEPSGTDVCSSLGVHRNNCVETTRDCVLDTECSNECVLSDWTVPTCSRTCGGGTRQLTREVVREAEGTATPCDEYDLSTTQPCNIHECPPCTYEPIDGTCVGTCGVGQMDYQIVGSQDDCTSNSDMLQQNCDTGVVCEADCTWETVGPCDKDCGTGSQSQTGNCGVRDVECNTHACNWDAFDCFGKGGIGWHAGSWPS